ncbi:IS66 family insertion sequence element accessory protein TnpB, partial [Pseudomonas alliivorans]|nr:IS66 family insertion sequence element accessory protein TnpB [Pseudomonas alliivorans]MEE4876128.1 IS66 family insertion sequence element accessory protein TnpB [Pseudomonas alliivorans]
MMRPDAKVEKVYLYPKPVDFRKSIDGLAALVELDIKVAVFNPVFFVFLNRQRNRVKILYWERNGFCLWLKRLESERFVSAPLTPHSKRPDDPGCCAPDSLRS